MYSSFPKDVFPIHLFSSSWPCFFLSCYLVCMHVSCAANVLSWSHIPKLHNEGSLFFLNLNQYLTHLIFFVFFFVLFKYNTYKQKIYSHQTLYPLVCLGINQQKSAPKSIRYVNSNLNIIQLKGLEQIFAGWRNIHK